MDLNKLRGDIPNIKIFSVDLESNACNIEYDQDEFNSFLDRNNITHKTKGDILKFISELINESFVSGGIDFLTFSTEDENINCLQEIALNA